MDILNQSFSFDEVSLKRDVKLAVIIFNVRGQRDEITFRPLEFTLCIMQVSRFSQDLHVNNRPASILHKSTSGRHRPVRVADGPMTARYRLT